MRRIRDIFRSKLVAPDTPVAFGYKCKWLALEEDALGYHFLDFNTIDWDELTEEEERTLYRSFPNEDHVMALAGAWSINPQTLPELGLAPSLGYLGRLPA